MSALKPPPPPSACCISPSRLRTYAFELIYRRFSRKDEHRVALVMEYAAGGELLHRIRQRRRLPDTEAEFYAAEIADALQYMHDEVGYTYLLRER